MAIAPSEEVSAGLARRPGNDDPAHFFILAEGTCLLYHVG